ncbi:hypothetical protein HU200_056079 [Digitaria exilis]|uniref:starch synthase n=1 Tax=Digitaria exilis TaxID=1010633 RepID=A0A835AHG5_9POAL|nr:hypothetical protein HU200_056079 [Digitaria exilis]
MYPKIKVNAFRGYSPKVTIQSITVKSEHHDYGEETTATYNKQLGTDVDSTSGIDGETAKRDPLRSASSCLPFRETDVAEKVGLDIFEAESQRKVGLDIFESAFPGNALINISLGEVEAVDEFEVEADKFEVDFSGIALSSATIWNMESKDETNNKENIFVVDLSRITPDNAAVGEVINDAEGTWETFDVDLSGDLSSIGTYGNVDEVGEPQVDQEVTFEMDMSRPRELNVVDHAKVKINTLQMGFLSSAAGNEMYMALESSEENLADGENGQGKYQGRPSISLKDNAINDTWETSRFPEQDLSIVKFPEKNHAIVGSPKQDVGFLEHRQAIVGSYEHDKLIVGSPGQQDKSIIGVSEQIESIVSYNKSGRSIVGSNRHDNSIVSMPEKAIVSYYRSDEYVAVSHKQDESIGDVPEQIQSIISYSTPDQGIVGLPRPQQSIVHTPERKQSVVGFHIQDLSFVGKSIDSPKKQQAIVWTHDTLLTKSVEAKDGDYTPQKTNGGTFQTKFDGDNLLQKYREGSTKEASKIITSMKIEEHLVMIEEQKSIRLDEEQWLATKEGMSMNEAEFSPFSEKVISWAEDEVGVTEEEEDETSVFVDQVLQRTLQGLAEKNYSLGSKTFVFPEVLKADSTVDLYFNRDLSALAKEPNILIKGAFNGWKWSFFTEKLHMSELEGEWWCCKLYIPKQAYRLDFVFFNNDTVYENNENNDFMIQIESTMDEHLFEDFLVEEKQRELEKLAIEEAERRRHAEKQQRMEEKRAEHEADKAQANAEVEMKKNKLRNVLGLARPSIDSLWYIEPVTTGQGAAVRLYYNRNARPLVQSSEIWMHGGYNNWIDGLSVSERLVHLDDKENDWWYADDMVRSLLVDLCFLLLIQAKRTAKMKAERKKKTMNMFLVSQKHIVYTEPLEIHAGTTVDVLYNPSNTVLTGKLEVWFRCSFNRWMHPCGVLPPQKMIKSANGAHLKATECSFSVKVPQDAYMMDFVFSESKEGGVYDNRNGLDYHIPVFGSTAKESPLHVVQIAVEMAPIAKVGGLADVVTSLSRAVQDLGHNVEVILPKHDCLNLSHVKNLHMHRSFSFGGSEIKVWHGVVEDLRVYFLEPQNGIYKVGCVYGRNDDRRFGFFCHCALEFLLQSGSSPVPVISNIMATLFLNVTYYTAMIGQVLLLPEICFVDVYLFTCYYSLQVSNAYSREVSGHGAITPHLGKFYGILNGIDPDIWDPYNDNLIPIHYTSENVVEGKSAAKKALQQKLGLEQNDVPLVGIVTRLTGQKGIHLIKHAIHQTLERNGQVPRMAHKTLFCLVQPQTLESKIYAGSDFILVPSIFEPCGLTQLVAMRYGAIPIVRKTGGKHNLAEPGLLNSTIVAHHACPILLIQGDLCLVRRPELVSLPLQESHGAGLVVEPACPGLHRALSFGVQIVIT